MKNLLAFTGRFLYRLMGWTYDELPEYWCEKQVVIGFPHTCYMDTVRALAYMKAAKIDAKLLVKAESFFWPMSILLKALGGIPVVRNKALGFVASVVAEFHQRDKFILAMVPEGTRKDVTRIKTGFWHIAKEAGVPIVCWYLDNEARKTRWLGCIEPGEEMVQDLLKIQDIYRKAGYEIPLGDLSSYGR